MVNTNFHLRCATPNDAMAITILYQQVYSGNYPNPLMRDISILENFLNSPANVWIIAEFINHDDQKSIAERKHLPQIIGSVVYETDFVHRVARAFGGAVLQSFRGSGILEKSMLFAQEHMMTATNRVDVVYATTRTSSAAPQRVTEHLGYKKLGIFPNVHKTDVFETHCLTALFTPEALWTRFQKFKIHPRVKPLFEIVRTECTIPSLDVANSQDLALDNYDAPIDLELISAEKYSRMRYESQRSQELLQAHFYPFHSPNMVISSPCQSVEIFVFIAAADKHCTIIGVKKPREFNFTHILDQSVKLLTSIGVRYIEILVRADKVKTLDRVIQARFTPCAYFPAFQLHNNMRYDFVVLSRTFEILDFQNINLAGKNRVYLDEYIKNIQEQFLRPKTTSEE